MRKIFLLLLVGALSCGTIAACSNNSEMSNVHDSESDNINIDTTLPSSDISEKESYDIVEKTENVKEANDTLSKIEYEGLLEDFVDAFISDNRIKTLEMQAPDGFIDIIPVLRKNEEYEDYSEDEFLSEWQGNLYDNYNEDLKWDKAAYKRIVDIEPVENEDLLEDTKILYGCMEWLEKYVNEHEEIDADTIDDAIYNDDDYIEYVEIKEAYYVTIEVECEKTGETLQGKLLVYNIYEGEWKVSCFFDGFLVNKKTAATEVARRLLKAGNSALVEMDEEGILSPVNDYYIVSSEDSKKYNVPIDFDYDIFEKKVHNFMGIYISEDWEWFIFINKNQTVEFSVVVSKGSVKPVGVDYYKFPYAEIKNAEPTFDEVYQAFIEEITQK